MTLEVLARYGLGMLAVVAAFGFIIFIHELGHFLIARRVGIRCPYFAIGFGWKLFSFKWKGTEFSVRAFPFGGFVLMVGEDPGSQDSWHSQLATFLSDMKFPATKSELLAHLDTLEPAADDRQKFEEVREHVLYLEDRPYRNLTDMEGNFNHKTIPQRIAVVAGGVVMNFIAAAILLWGIGFTWGLPQLGQVAEPVIASTRAGTPAAAAKLQTGDRVETIAGQPVVSGPQMIKLISQYPAEPVEVGVRRQGKLTTVKLTPDVWTADNKMLFQPGEGGLKLDGDQLPPGLSQGDLVESINGHKVTALTEVVELIRSQTREVDPDKTVTLELQLKGGKQVKVTKTAANWQPEGKIGIIPASPLQVHFSGDKLLRVAAVRPGSPAAEARLEPGQEIVQIDGLSVFTVKDADEALAQLARNPTNKPIELLVGRPGDEEPTRLRVKGNPASLEAMGVELADLSTAEVLWYPIDFIQRITFAPVTIVAKIFQKKVEAGEVAKSASGPLGIMRLIFSSTRDIAVFLFMVAFINAAVGGFNLIPFPALDGMRIVILALAGLRGREFDPEKEARIHYVGLMVLLALVVVVTFMDISNIRSGIPLLK